MPASPLRLVRSPAPPAGPTPSRPEVQISSASRAVNVDALDLAMRALPDAYQRGHAIVEVVPSRRPKMLAEGTPTIRAMSVHSLGTMVDRHITCLRYHARSGQWIESACPVELALLPLLHFCRWEHLRPLDAVVETPFLRPDGTIWQAPGYDDGTGFLYRPNATFPLVPDRPTQEDARRAIVSLAHVFTDFPYTTPAARYVPIACLLTILARAAIDGNVPVFAFEASVQGSGKTMQGDIVHLIATGRLAPHSSWPEDEDEQRKGVLSMAIGGSPVFFLDNLKGLFGGPVIENICTTGEIRQRMLGRSEDVQVRWLATMIVTGNNMRMTADMLRRSLLCRIEPDVEDPTRGRTYEHDDLPAWVQAERERLVVCALTILRAYTCHGMPDTGAGTMQSFAAWSRLIPGAIMFAGGPNVLDAVGNSEDAATDEAEAVACVIRELGRLSAVPIAAKGIVSALYPAPKAGEQPDGWDELRTALEALAPTRNGAPPTPKSLGDALRDHKGQVSAGRRLRTRIVHGRKLWSVETVKRP